MKITNQQLKRIIKEEMLQGNDLEAFYALIYTAQYVTRYNDSLANAWRNYSMSGVDDSSPEYRQTLKGHGKLYNALEKLDTNLLGPIMDLDAGFDAPPSETLADADVLSQYTNLSLFVVSLNKVEKSS